MFALILVVFFLGCIGQEEVPPETITKVQTETEVKTVLPPVTTPEVMNPFLWSGKLDGEGIPPDFFTDLDLRKAFAYAFDFDKYIEYAHLGEAINPITPVIMGLPYRNPEQTGYSYDMAKAEEHFKKAWNGEVWEKGFMMTMLYLSGVESWRIGAGILKEGVESLNDKFWIHMQPLVLPAFMESMFARQMPIFWIGWVGDFPDPHNWVHPFMHSTGTFGWSQGYSNVRVDELIEEGIKETAPEKRREIYYELQKLYVEEVPSVITDQPSLRLWERDWVQGTYYNPMHMGPYFYDQWKTADANNPDTYVMAIETTPETMDPAWAYDIVSATAIQNIYDRLIGLWHDPEKVVPNTLNATELTAPIKFIPMLAEEVPTVENGGISVDGLTYTFKIKTGIKFHNGNDLTPEDVEYSFERAMVQDRSGGAIWALYEPLLGRYHSRDDEGNLVVPFEDIDQVVEVEGDNVVFHLAMPYAPFLHILSLPYAASIVDKEWCIEHGCWPGTAETYPDYNDPEVSPINDIAMGTGPFKLEWWNKGVEYALVRNDAYWRGPAKLQRVLVETVEEWSTRELMFLTGDADTCAVPTAYQRELEGIEGIRYIKDLPLMNANGFFFTFDISVI